MARVFIITRNGKHLKDIEMPHVELIDDLYDFYETAEHGHKLVIECDF